MNKHVKGRARQYILAILFFSLASILALWSWNTLAELFSWPVAQYKHVLATFAILFFIRFTLFTHKQHEKIDSITH